MHSSSYQGNAIQPTYDSRTEVLLLHPLLLLDMLTHFRRPVCLSLVSTDLPICTNVETVATLYQRDSQRFHLLLTEPQVSEAVSAGFPVQEDGLINPEIVSPVSQDNTDPLRLIWLEMSPQRVTMTMQGNSKLSYRHFWDRNNYGMSRYWLQGDILGQSHQLQFRNFTVDLQLKGDRLPDLLHLDYELWSAQSRLGRYLLHLEIQH
ncbi:MAG: hypothetical protein VKJ24_12785 [Synechococcales bacterium]|nr:hypothetical protein [Synechococcales bacterium]